MTQNIDWNDFKRYMILFFVPSSTPLYILLHDFGNMAILPAYLIANALAGVITYFTYKSKIMIKAVDTIDELTKLEMKNK